jgi:hypothetical protein
MTDRNLYAPPSADVRDVSMTASVGEESFNPDGRSCPAGAGWRWYGAAWRIFKAQPLGWWLVLLLIFGLMGLASVLPLLGLLSTLLFPILIVGMGSCARSVLRGDRFEIRQVFDGFGPRRKVLMQAGAIYLLFSVLSMGVMALLSGGSLGAVYLGSMAERQAAMRGLFLGGGLAMWGYFIMGCLAMSAILFSPYLIQEQNLSAPQAMVMSFKACFKNIPATLVWMLSYIVWAVVATIPVGLGWLVLIPVLCLSSYVAYRDIFYA